jgi:DNA-binding transcriptional MerR regulator
LPENALTLPQVAELADVEYRTLHTWVKRGLLEPSLRRSEGTGTPNLFRTEDAVAARVLADLRRAGLSIEALEGASSALRDARDSLARPAVLLVNGTVTLYADFESATDALDRPGATLVYRTREAVERVVAALDS